MNIAIRGIDHVVLRVRDEAAALAFYCGVLGCVEERRLDALGLIQLRAGSSLIDIVPAEGDLGAQGGPPPPRPGEGGRNMDHLCLRVEPWDEAGLIAHLRVHGIEPGETGRRYGAEGQGPSIYIADPDGNTVELKGPPEE